MTKRGKTVVPAAIHKRYDIKGGDQLVLLNDGETIRVVPAAADPVAALRGRGKGEALVERLLIERAAERKRER